MTPGKAGGLCCERLKDATQNREPPEGGTHHPFRGKVGMGGV